MPDAADPTTLLEFALTATALICTPGPGTALTVTTALEHGRRAGCAVAAGVVLGQAAWVAASACGAATALGASDALAAALAAAGAAYLIVLGARGLAAAFARTPDEAVTRVAGGRRALQQGLVSNLLNPKMLVVAASLLPAAALGRAHPAAWTLLLGALFCAIATVWLVGWALLAGSGRGVRPRTVRAVRAVGGAALVVLGARLLAGAVG